MDNIEKKYPVLFYDIDNENREKVMDTLMELREYYEKENIPFVFIPKHYIELEFMTKTEAIKILNEIIKEVEKWD